MMKKPEQYLVVDDDSTNNMICQLNIQRFNPDATIQLFTKPEEALDFAGKVVVDESERAARIILFLDINMPTMTGWEFLDVFMKLPETIKQQYEIYILTSAIQKFEKEKEKYPFVAGFLSKPLTKNILQELFGSVQKKDPAV